MCNNSNRSKHCLFDTGPDTRFDSNLANILVTNHLVNNLVVNLLSVILATGSFLFGFQILVSNVTPDS